MGVGGSRKRRGAQENCISEDWTEKLIHTLPIDALSDKDNAKYRI